jgi:hypothetical protein
MKNQFIGVIKILKIQEMYLGIQIINIYLIVFNVIMNLALDLRILIKKIIGVIIVQIKKYVIIMIVRYVLINHLHQINKLYIGQIKIKLIQEVCL